MDDSLIHIFNIFLFSPDQLIQSGGILIIIFLLFAETGLLLGLVIPGGETLLFTTGLLLSTDNLKGSLLLILAALIVAGILGDLSGYRIGKKLGKKLYDKEDTWYFKQKYLKSTEEFYQRNKKTSLIFGKFLPIIRPFNPLIAGISKINFHVFLPLSSIGNCVFIGTFVLLGYFLGGKFPVIKDYLGWIIPISILAAFIPVILQIRKQKKAQKN